MDEVVDMAKVIGEKRVLKCSRCGKSDGPDVRLYTDIAWKGKSPVCGECITFVTKEFPKSNHIGTPR